jgi:phosphatidylserine/phosphatidylglycerophosphate/cardiolipin synthase-like enzyme
MEKPRIEPGRRAVVRTARSRRDHAKHVSIDGVLALIGSSNMDIRSFVLDAEVSLAIYDSDVVAQLREPRQDFHAAAVSLPRCRANIKHPDREDSLSGETRNAAGWGYWLTRCEDTGSIYVSSLDCQSQQSGLKSRAGTGGSAPS